MSKSYYNTSQMKSGAASISAELKQFKSAKENIDSIIRSLKWEDDDIHRQYVSRYQREAQKSAEEMYQQINKYAELLAQCSKKYASVIDNGNSLLSGK